MRVVQPAFASSRPRSLPTNCNACPQHTDHKAHRSAAATPAGDTTTSRVVSSGAVQHDPQDSTIELSRSRRAALIAVGVSPWLIAAAPASAASSEPSVAVEPETTSSSSSSSGQDGTQDDSAGSAGAAAAGEDSDDAAASQQQQQQDRDDSPSALLEDDEEDSSSSSSSSSDEGDSDSSSDEEPGELFASSDDNNNAAGGSGSDGSSSSSGTLDNGTTSEVRTVSNSNTSSSSGSNGGSVNRTNMGSNLSVPSYFQLLQDARRSSWPILAQKIQAGDWIALSQLLVQPPFDAVRQACFYIPWALLQCDDFTAAVAARKAYVDYIDHVHALAAIALKAADGVSGADVQVQQAFTLMNASLDAFLAAVPTKYQRYRI